LSAPSRSARAQPSAGIRRRVVCTRQE